MRGSIETLYRTDDWGAKVLDLLTTSLTASIYSNYEGKIRLFAEFCIDEEGISPLDCTEATCIRYLAWIAERGTIGAGSLQPYLLAINTFMHHTGRDDAPATGPAIIDIKWALKIRQLKTIEELRRAPLPYDVITNILDDLADPSITTPGYGTILRKGAAGSDLVQRARCGAGHVESGHPTARTVMTPHELREVAAGYFFLPGPCLAPVVGRQIILPSTEHNPVTVDLYGDALMNLPAHGDAHWRVQHDDIADAFRDHCVHDLGIVVRRKVDYLFQQAVPLGNTVPMDELEDLVPDAKLSLPAFNVVTGSYDPRSLKPTLLEFKAMRYGVKYTAMPRATAVDRFERSLMLGDIQRGLAARDAA
eukprot:jgi/Tetstr1/464518/TSEL_009276.t1